MRKRAVRISILTFLLTASLAATFFLWDIQRRTVELTAADDALAERLDGIATTVVAIGTAQQGYVAPGQLDEPWFERMTMLLEQLNRELAAVRPSLRTADAIKTFDSIGATRKALVAADERIRENLTLGQELMAADVIFSDGRNSVDAISAGLHEVRTSERSRNRAERAAFERERWIVLGLATLAWFAVVVVLLSVVPHRAPLRARDCRKGGGGFARFGATARPSDRRSISRRPQRYARTSRASPKPRHFPSSSGVRLRFWMPQVPRCGWARASNCSPYWDTGTRRRRCRGLDQLRVTRTTQPRKRGAPVALPPWVVPKRVLEPSSRRCLVQAAASASWPSKADRSANTTRHCKPSPHSSLRRSRRRSPPGQPRRAPPRHLRRDPPDATFSPAAAGLRCPIGANYERQWKRDDIEMGRVHTTCPLEPGLRDFVI